MREEGCSRREWFMWKSQVRRENGKHKTIKGGEGGVVNNLVQGEGGEIIGWDFK